MKNSRILTGVLALALLFVWGKIGLQIAGAVGGEESEVVLPERVQRSPGEIRFEFPESMRDPFVYGSLPQAATRVKRTLRPSEVPWMPPCLRLSGVVVEPGGSTAMVESGDGRVHFLRQGDTLQGARVLRIGSDVVTYSFRNKKAEWVLDSK